MAENEVVRLSNQLLLEQAEGERDRAISMARWSLAMAVIASLSGLGQCALPVYKIWKPDKPLAPVVIPAPIVNVQAPPSLVIPAPVVNVIVSAAGSHK